MSCVICSAPVVEAHPVGDLMGFRASDVACSDECAEECEWEAHVEATPEDERPCTCDTCRRVRVRIANRMVMSHVGPRPEVVLLGERFCAELGGE